MSSAKWIVVFCAALFLCGCNGVSLATLWKMRKINPLTTDPAQLRIALRAPEWMTPLLDHAQLRIRADIWGGEPIVGSFRLSRTNDPRDVTALRDAGLNSENMLFFAVASSATRSMRDILEQISAVKKTGHVGRMSVGLWNRDLAGCTSFQLPEGPVIVDVYVRLNDATGWVPFYEGHDFRAEIDSDRQSMNASVCDNDKDRNVGNHDAGSGRVTKLQARELKGAVSFQSGK